MIGVGPWLLILAATGGRILGGDPYAELSSTGREEYREWARAKLERDHRCLEEAERVLDQETRWIDEANDRLGEAWERLVTVRALHDSLRAVAPPEPEDRD